MAEAALAHTLGHFVTPSQSFLRCVPLWSLPLTLPYARTGRLEGALLTSSTLPLSALWGGAGVTRVPSRDQMLGPFTKATGFLPFPQPSPNPRSGSTTTPYSPTALAGPRGHTHWAKLSVVFLTAAPSTSKDTPQKPRPNISSAASSYTRTRHKWRCKSTLPPRLLSQAHSRPRDACRQGRSMPRLELPAPQPPARRRCHPAPAMPPGALGTRCGHILPQDTPTPTHRHAHLTHTRSTRRGTRTDTARTHTPPAGKSPQPPVCKHRGRWGRPLATAATRALTARGQQAEGQRQEPAARVRPRHRAGLGPPPRPGACAAAGGGRAGRQWLREARRRGRGRGLRGPGPSGGRRGGRGRGHFARPSIAILGERPARGRPASMATVPHRGPRARAPPNCSCAPLCTRRLLLSLLVTSGFFLFIFSPEPLDLVLVMTLPQGLLHLCSRLSGGQFTEALSFSTSRLDLNPA